MVVLADLNPSYVTFNDGKWDSRQKYLRQVATTGAFGICAGPTYSCGGGGTPGGTDVAIDFRYLVGSRDVREGSGLNSTAPSNSRITINLGTNTSGTTGASLDISPGSMIIQDAATGRLLLDTSVPTMHVLTSLNSSVVLPARNASGAQSYVDTTFASLGAIDTSATHIIGAVKVVWDNGSTIYNTTVGVNGDTWYFVNGSLVVFSEYGDAGVGGATNQIIGTQRNRLVSFTQLTFRASGGTCLLDESTRIYKLFNGGQPPTDTAKFSRSGATMYYKLKACVFT